jgi:myo-inositol-1(or 4)-monophosphatase
MLNGTPIHAAETTALDRAVVEVGWSHRRPNHDFFALCEKLLTQGATLRLGGSGALGLAEVAAGCTDASVELHINLWDVAAGLVLLSEAGAAVSPLLTGDGPIAGNPILAGARGLADALFPSVWGEVSLP